MTGVGGVGRVAIPKVPSVGGGRFCGAQVGEADRMRGAPRGGSGFKLDGRLCDGGDRSAERLQAPRQPGDAGRQAHLVRPRFSVDQPVDHLAVDVGEGQAKDRCRLCLR